MTLPSGFHWELQHAGAQPGFQVPLWATSVTSGNGLGYRGPGQLRGMGCSPLHAVHRAAGLGLAGGHLWSVPVMVTCLLLSLDSFQWCDMIPTHHTGAVISNIAINPLLQMGIDTWMKPGGSKMLLSNFKVKDVKAVTVTCG